MRPLRFALTSACLTLALAAQTAPCLHDNDLTNAQSSAFFGMSSSGPGVWAWQITPGSVTVAESIRIFMGHNYSSQTGEFAKLEIWDESNLAPGQPLGGGVWRIRLANQWQGCNLDSQVVMQANTPYWIVLTEPGWTNVPIQSFGGNNLPMLRYDGPSNSWQPMNAPEALKYRIYCNKLDDQGIVPYGPACPSSAGELGTVFVNTTPTVGNASFRFEGSGFPPGTMVLGVIGTNALWPSIPLPGAPGCFVNTDISVTLSLVTGVGDVRSTSPSGHTELPVPVPTSSGLIGFFLSAQFAALDLGLSSPLLFVTSNALQVTIY